MLGRLTFGTHVFSFSSADLAPTVNAGPDKIAPVSATSAVLLGSALDPEAGVLLPSWSFISGPNTPTLVTPNSFMTTVTGLVYGSYVFRLTVTDGPNTVYDEVTLTVPKRNKKGIGVIVTEKRGVVIESVF
jgi:hypothetical protein